MRMNRVEMASGSGIYEPVEGDGPRFLRGIEEAGDPPGTIAEPRTALAVGGGRVEAIAGDAPAVEGDGVGDLMIKDLAGDALDPEAQALGIGAVEGVEVRAEPRVDRAVEGDGSRRCCGGAGLRRGRRRVD